MLPKSPSQAWPSKVKAQAGFQQYDTDGDGGLGPTEIVRLAQHVQGKRPSLQEASGWIFTADVNGNGLLEFDEFWALLRQEQAAATPSQG
jgi:Ca2+-binding EF-hand superfamily protein